MRTLAFIKKSGSEWCVYSKDGKPLGCYKTQKEAEERLRQIEYFKHKAESMNENKMGTIAGVKSDLVLDGKDHLPILNVNQACSAVNRVLGLSQSPDWFKGSVDNLKTIVKNAVCAKYPNLNVSVAMTVESALANIMVKNPNKNAPKVPGVKTPCLSRAEKDDLIEAIGDSSNNFANASALIDNLEKCVEDNKKMITVLKKISKDGLSAKEFESLIDYLQIDIARELIYLKSKATSETVDANSRLGDLLAKFKNNGGGGR